MPAVNPSNFKSAVWILSNSKVTKCVSLLRGVMATNTYNAGLFTNFNNRINFKRNGNKSLYFGIEESNF